jgi:hypothetical protein
MIVKGTFEVTMKAEPPYETVEQVTLGRASFDKRFSGPLTATGTVQMLAARGPVPSSAGYVALERISGTLDGKRGTFALVHLGLMERGAPSLTVAIVPDSGTGELRGIRGRMAIDIVEGQHHYTLDYAYEAS